MRWIGTSHAILLLTTVPWRSSFLHRWNSCRTPELSCRLPHANFESLRRLLAGGQLELLVRRHVSGTISNYLSGLLPSLNFVDRASRHKTIRRHIGISFRVKDGTCRNSRTKILKGAEAVGFWDLVNINPSFPRLIYV